MEAQHISIIGFGKIGQAIATNMLANDLHVHAVDVSDALIGSFAAGAFVSTEPGVQDQLIAAYAEERLTVSDDYSSVDSSSAIIITIPLGVDAARLPLTEPFLDCIRQLSPFLTNGVLLSIETSVPVGFCRKTIEPFLHALGRQHGTHYLLGHSPERIKSGTMLHQLVSLPKIIGGLSEKAAELMMDVYERFIPAPLLGRVNSIEDAEFVKMAGMIYRDLNIALANQLAGFAQVSGISLPSLLPLINSDNEANLLAPGIGVGGHCTPVYPWFMIDAFRNEGLEFSLALDARRINEEMGRYAVSLVASMSLSGKALILGLAFRPGVREHVFSPAFNVRDELKAAGFEVLLHDPLYASSELHALGFNSPPDIYGSGASLLILVTRHAFYDSLDYHRLAAEGVKCIVDGRNGLPVDRIEAAGIRYIGIGMG